jgi:hypothetical protein
MASDELRRQTRGQVMHDTIIEGRQAIHCMGKREDGDDA